MNIVLKKALLVSVILFRFVFMIGQNDSILIIAEKGSQAPGVIGFNHDGGELATWLGTLIDPNNYKYVVDSLYEEGYRNHYVELNPEIIRHPFRDTMSRNAIIAILGLPEDTVLDDQPMTLREIVDIVNIGAGKPEYGFHRSVLLSHLSRPGDPLFSLILSQQSSKGMKIFLYDIPTLEFLRFDSMIQVQRNDFYQNILRQTGDRKEAFQQASAYRDSLWAQARLDPAFWRSRLGPEATDLWLEYFEKKIPTVSGKSIISVGAYHLISNFAQCIGRPDDPTWISVKTKPFDEALAKKFPVSVLFLQPSRVPSSRKIQTTGEGRVINVFVRPR